MVHKRSNPSEQFVSGIPRSSSEFFKGKQHTKNKMNTLAETYGKSAQIAQELEESEGSDSDENPYERRHANSMYLMHDDDAGDLFHQPNDDEREFRAQLRRARKQEPSAKLSAVPSMIMESDAVVQLGGDAL